jgi:hypothetical protein
MNYQSNMLVVYSVKLFLMLSIAVVAAFFSVSAPILYLFSLGVILPVIASLRLHLLKEKKLVDIPSVKSEWMVYTFGLPVQETRNILTNPGFSSIKLAKKFYSQQFFIKLVLQVALFINMLINSTDVPLWLIPGIIVIGFYMLYAIWRSAHALISIKHWRLEPLCSPAGEPWHFGFMMWRGKAQPLFDRVLALQ